jgi:hypothetical protein
MGVLNEKRCNTNLIDIIKMNIDFYPISIQISYIYLYLKYEKPIDGIVIDTNFFNDMCLHIIFWFIQTKTYNSQTILDGGRKNCLSLKTKKRIRVKRKISRKKIGGAGENIEKPVNIVINMNNIVVFSCIKLLKLDKTKINEILPFVSMTPDTYDKMYRYMRQQYINMDFG